MYIVNLQKKLRRVHMLDSDEEDEGEGGVAIGEPTAVGGVGEPTGATPTIGEEEELSNDNENFSHVSACNSASMCQCSFERRGKDLETQESLGREEQS